MKHLRLSHLSCLATLVVCLGLSGCAAPLMLGGILGTAMVASDRRSTGVQLDDEAIEQRSSSAIRENFGTKEHINVTSYNRQVLITGEVSSELVRTQAQQVMGKIAEVRGVVNELIVAPASGLGERSRDALLVAKVKAAMVDSEDVFANVFKVVAERETIYLMGRVTAREAQRATDVVRGVSGVKRVVRVFETLTEDELRNLQPPRTGDNADKWSTAPSPSNSPSAVTGPVATPVK